MSAPLETTKDCLSWGTKVLADEGLSDWKLEWSASEGSEGRAFFKTKTIILHWPEDKPWPALVLHEIAHAMRQELAGHDSQFAHDYMWLVTRWMSPNTNCTKIPCARCGGPCVEFTVPNDVWNAVVRRGGSERDDEYICEACYRKAVEGFVWSAAAPQLSCEGKE